MARGKGITLTACIELAGDDAHVKPRPLHGAVVVPPSKSETHRALILAARSSEPVRVHQPLRAQDTQATREAIEAFGASVDDDRGSWLVRSKRLGPPDGANQEALSHPAGNNSRAGVSSFQDAAAVVEARAAVAMAS